MLEELIIALKTNPHYPLQSVVYGYSDKLDPPRINVLNLSQKPEYDTSGIVYYQNNFELHIWDKDLGNGAAIEDAVTTLLAGLHLNAKSMGFILDGSEILQEDLYQYHLVQHWIYYQNA